MSVNIYNSSTGELTPLAGIPYETLNSKANKTVISPSSTAETSATASKSHTENDYFELNGMMVQALDDINIGDTLTEGINYRVTDISTELEIINTNIDNKADKDNLTNISVSGTTNTTESTITSGTFFYKSGILVRAKADIAVNATLTENTNYEVVTAGGLNKLTNDVLDVASVANSAASTANSASSVASRADDMIWKSTDQYSTSKAYSVGDYVIRNNTIYKCTTACSAGSWSTNSSCFTSTTLSTAVTELNSALTSLVITENVYISVTFSNSLTARATKSVAKTGYTPVGVVGWYQGTGAHVFISIAQVSGNNLTVESRRANNDAASLTVEFTIIILYKKNV